MILAKLASRAMLMCFKQQSESNDLLGADSSVTLYQTSESFAPHDKISKITESIFHLMSLNEIATTYF